MTPSHIRIRVAYVSCASQVSRVWYGDRNRSLRRRTECTDSYRTLPFSTTSTQGQGSCHHLRVTIPGLQTRARPPPTEDQATVAKPARAAAQVSVRPCSGRRPPRTPCTVHLSLHVQTHTYYGWSPAADGHGNYSGTWAREAAWLRRTGTVPLHLLDRCPPASARSLDQPGGNGIHFVLTRLTGPGPGTTRRLHASMCECAVRPPCAHAS